MPEPLEVLKQALSFISREAEHQGDGRRVSATTQERQDAEHGEVGLRQCGRRHVGSFSYAPVHRMRRPRVTSTYRGRVLRRRPAAR